MICVRSLAWAGIVAAVALVPTTSEGPLGIPVASAAVPYKLVELPPLDVLPQGISNTGQVVGRYVSQNSNVPFLWENGSMIDLCPGQQGMAYGINNQRQVVGDFWSTSAKKYHAFIWQDGTWTDIDPNGPGRCAYAINDYGQVAGGEPYDGAYLGFVWSEQHGLTDLPPLGGSYSIALDINNLGVAVGFSKLANDVTRRATMWQNGTPTDLGTLDGYENSYACAINDRGQVVGGCYNDAVGVRAAFLWTQQDGMTDLGFSGGADDINNQGQVIGSWGGVLWEGGQVWSLKDLVTNPPTTYWYLIPDAINNSGQIVGHETLWNPELGTNVDHGFLLTPIPEPATLSLLAVGGLLVLRRHCSRRLS